MTETTDKPELFPQSDRWTFLWIIVFAVVLACGVVVDAVLQLSQIIPNADVPVTVRLPDEAATLPLGPGGSGVDVSVDRAILSLSGLPPAPYAALIAEVSIHALSLLGALACAAFVVLNLARGRAFTRDNTVLLVVMAGAIGLDLVAGSFLRSYITAAATAQISDGAYVAPNEPMDFLKLFLFFGLGAVARAFAVGERLQRDTEGLV